MPLAIETASESPSQKLEQVSATLRRLYGRGFEIKTFSDPGKGVMKIESGGDFHLNEAKLAGLTLESCIAQTISVAEAWQMQIGIRQDPQFATEVATYEAHKDRPSYKLLYGVLFESVALRDKALTDSSLQQVAMHTARQRLQKLKRRFPHVLPPQVQYLIGLIDPDSREIQDTEVQKAIGDLQSSGILRKLFDHRVNAGTKLRTIHGQIFQDYRYFLRQAQHPDAKWAKQKKEPKKIRQRSREEIEQIMNPPGRIPPSHQLPPAPPEVLEEMSQESSSEPETPDPSSGPEPEESEEVPELPDMPSLPIPEQNDASDKSSSTPPDSPQGTPDYQDEYSTPEGGEFEKDPSGKGYKLEISPPLLGYYSTDRKSYWNAQRKKWANKSSLTRYKNIARFTGKKYNLSGEISGQNLKPFPLPVGYVPDLDSLQYTGDKPTVYRDQNGCFQIKLSGQGKCQLSIDFYKEDDQKSPHPISEDSEQMYAGSLSGNAQQAFVKAEKEVDSKKKAAIVRDYVRKNHFYPPGKNDMETMNAAKKIQAELQNISDAQNYIHNLDNSPHLECYSANNLMVAMVRALRIPARIVTGHHVQHTNTKGNAEINSANGHGWCEIWDGNSWVGFDATPPPDLNDPKNKSDPADQDENEEQEPQDQSPAENADDGAERTDTSEDDGEGEEGGEPQDGADDGQQSDEEGDGETSEKPPGEKGEGDADAEIANEEDGKGSEQDGDGGEQTDEVDDDFDPKEELERMYEELIEETAGMPDEEEIKRTLREIEREAAAQQALDPEERYVQDKHPGLTPELRRQIAEFIREFRRDMQIIEQIPNPDPESPHTTFMEAFKAMIDRIVSRRYVERRVRKYPTTTGRLVRPVTRHTDKLAGKRQSYAFKTRERKLFEEKKITKVRWRTIIDRSGSMDSQKLRTQQQIEVLKNAVVAEKQIELNELSARLKQDLRLETETWQFGGPDPETGQQFSCIKPLSSTFDELEQAAIWHAAASAPGGTNDFDPLEAIFRSLAAEEAEARSNDELSILERIRAGFLIREINAVQELGRKGEDELDEDEEVYFENLTKESPESIFRRLQDLLPRTSGDPAEIQQEQAFLRQRIDGTNAVQMFQEWTRQFIGNKYLSDEEKDFFRELDISDANLAAIYKDWLQVLKRKQGKNIEPILEIIEVSSDGGSNDPARLQNIVRSLRDLGIIVLCYGLGNDADAAVRNYYNDYNPSEGGMLCHNLLDYPEKKARAWQNMLDRV